MKLAVIGHPIHQSKSPLIHNSWMNENGIMGQYKAIDINPENLKTTIKTMVEDGYSGFNVTIPHKQAVMALCDDIDPTALKIGAVNTVKITEGKLKGYNTDAYGFITNVKNKILNFSSKDKAALVLGAGGAANAVIYSLIEAGFKKVYLTNRTRDKAVILKNMNEDIIEVISWDDKQNYINKVNLLVNTTSLGMTGQPELEINLSNSQENLIVSDIVYNPLHTNLLKNAQNHNCQIVTGIGMLIYQAQKSFEIWTGILPQISNNLEKDILS